MLRYQETEIVHISPQQIWGLVTCTLVRVSRPHGQLFADWCHNVQSVVLNLVPGTFWQRHLMSHRAYSCQKRNNSDLYHTVELYTDYTQLHLKR